MHQKIMIIGCCGAGKSTLARKLGAVLDLEIIHLDQHYWKPNWVESDASDWQLVVERLTAGSSWIIDGNYTGTIDIRLESADTIIWLDYSTIRCLYRITKRIIGNYGQVRPDMPEGCRERFDFEFYHYVATWNLIRRKSMLRKVAMYKDSKEIYVLKNNTQVTHFLQSLSGEVTG